MFHRVLKPASSDIKRRSSKYLLPCERSVRWRPNAYFGGDCRASPKAALVLTATTASIPGAGFSLSYLSDRPGPPQCTWKQAAPNGFYRPSWSEAKVVAAQGGEGRPRVRQCQSLPMPSQLPGDRCGTPLALFPGCRKNPASEQSRRQC